MVVALVRFLVYVLDYEVSCIRLVLASFASPNQACAYTRVISAGLTRLRQLETPSVPKADLVPCP